MFKILSVLMGRNAISDSRASEPRIIQEREYNGLCKQLRDALDPSINTRREMLTISFFGYRGERKKENLIDAIYTAGYRDRCEFHGPQFIQVTTKSLETELLKNGMRLEDFRDIKNKYKIVIGNDADKSSSIVFTTNGNRNILKRIHKDVVNRYLSGFQEEDTANWAKHKYQNLVLRNSGLHINGHA